MRDDTKTNRQGHVNHNTQWSALVHTLLLIADIVDNAEVENEDGDRYGRNSTKPRNFDKTHSSETRHWIVS
jgi:hypothetical protein